MTRRARNDGLRGYYEHRGTVYLDALMQVRELVRKQGSDELLCEVSELVRVAVEKASVFDE